MSLDVLSDVLRAIRLTGVVYFDFVLTPPWVAEAPPSATSPARSSRALSASSSTTFSRRGARGDTPSVVRRYTCGRGICCCSRRATRTCCRARRACVRRPISRPTRARRRRSRSFTNSAPGGTNATRLICGFFGCDERPYNPLLTALPSGDSPASRRHRCHEPPAWCDARHRDSGGTAGPAWHRERVVATVGADAGGGDPPLSGGAAQHAAQLAGWTPRSGRRTRARSHAQRADAIRGRLRNSAAR
jgi:hypothetical protein